MKSYVTVSAIALICASGAAMAQDEREITGTDVIEQAQEDNLGFSAEFLIEIENDYTFDSDDKGAELNDTYPSISAALRYGFSPFVSANLSLKFEPIEDPTGDRFFKDLGLYAEEAFLFFDFGPAQAALGKFNPAFGSAWDIAPGIYGTDFAGDYEITEKNGAQLIIPFQLAGGEHALSASLFMADRSILSGSLVSDRGQLHRSDGGVSNTGGPTSFNIGLNGDVSGTNYVLGFQQQSKGRGDTKDQVGGAFGLSRDFGRFELFGEVAYFDHFDGGTESATYATAGGAVPVNDRISLNAVYSYRHIGHGTKDHLATVTGEYAVIDSLVLALSYRYGDEEGVENHTFGTLVSYEF